MLLALLGLVSPMVHGVVSVKVRELGGVRSAHTLRLLNVLHGHSSLLAASGPSTSLFYFFFHT
jgi:hypothetical protein